jgi:polyisoprenoid-binding protein YceI
MQIKGQSKPVVLKAEYAGIAVDPYGQIKAGMTISGSIKRSDFGLTWSAVTEVDQAVSKLRTTRRASSICPTGLVCELKIPATFPSSPTT